MIRLTNCTLITIIISLAFSCSNNVENEVTRIEKRINTKDSICFCYQRIYKAMKKMNPDDYESMAAANRKIINDSVSQKCMKVISREEASWPNIQAYENGDLKLKELILRQLPNIAKENLPKCKYAEKYYQNRDRVMFKKYDEIKEYMETHK